MQKLEDLKGGGEEGWVIKADSSACMSKNDRKVIAFEKAKKTEIAQFVLLSKMLKQDKNYGGFAPNIPKSLP